jgi:hypothetical protein
MILQKFEDYVWCSIISSSHSIIMLQDQRFRQNAHSCHNIILFLKLLLVLFLCENTKLLEMDCWRIAQIHICVVGWFTFKLFLHLNCLLALHSFSVGCVFLDEGGRGSSIYWYKCATHQNSTRLDWDCERTAFGLSSGNLMTICLIGRWRSRADYQGTCCAVVQNLGSPQATLSVNLITTCLATELKSSTDRQRILLHDDQLESISQAIIRGCSDQDKGLLCRIWVHPRQPCQSIW